jgi:hypothetical protein
MYQVSVGGPESPPQAASSDAAATAAALSASTRRHHRTRRGIGTIEEPPGGHRGREIVPNDTTAADATIAGALASRGPAPPDPGAQEAADSQAPWSSA